MPGRQATFDDPDEGLNLEPVDDQAPYAPLRVAVLERLRNAILDGVLRPGSTLSESRLAIRLNVSRTPVREALRVLETEGLVALGRGRKLVVSAPTLKDIDEIYGIRLMVESEALRRIEPSNTEFVHKLESCIVRGAEGLKSAGSRALTDPHNDFHLVLISILDNRRLQDFVHSVYEFVTRFRFLSMEEESAAQSALQDHVEIVALLKRGRSEDAVSRLKEHIMKSSENLKRRFHQSA